MAADGAHVVSELLPRLLLAHARHPIDLQRCAVCCWGIHSPVTEPRKRLALPRHSHACGAALPEQQAAPEPCALHFQRRRGCDSGQLCLHEDYRPEVLFH